MSKHQFDTRIYDDGVKLDVYITNARVLTLDDERPTASVIGVLNGKIVGLDEEVAGLPARHTVDAGGRTIIPGFHDAHNHMATFGRSLLNVNAAEHTSLDSLYRAVAERATSQPDLEWITVDNYDQHQLGGHPTRAGLDHAAPDRNVIANHRTTHMLVASTPVFEKVGALDPSWPVPDGGFVERDGSGSPVGLIGEQAMGAFRALTRPYSVEELTEAIARASDYYLAEGITSVGEAGIGDSAIVGSSPIELLPYHNAYDAGRLGVRVRLMVTMENLHAVGASPDDLIDLGLDLGLRTGFGNDDLAIGALKMFTDGALSSRTAALTKPFCDHGGTGVMQFGREELTAIAASASRAGWQLAVHAIGDEAIDVGLDTIRAARQAAPGNRQRHRIEHASIVRDDQVRRFADEQVIASIQPEFVSAIGDTVLEAVGDRSDWVYRQGSLLSAGVRIAGGSDRPVVSGNPLRAVRDAVVRRTSTGQDLSPHEAVSVIDSIRTYTQYSAYATHMEHKIGTIRAGYYADFAVLDGDPLSTPAEDLASIPIAATIVSGEFRYDPVSLGPVA